VEAKGRKEGIILAPESEDKIRLVCHLEITRAKLQKTISFLETCISQKVVE